MASTQIRNLALKDEVVLKSLPAEEQEALIRTASAIWERSVQVAEAKNAEKLAKYENFKKKFRSYLLSLPGEYKVDTEQIHNGEYDHIASEIYQELSKIPPSDKMLFHRIHESLELLGIIDEDTSRDKLSHTQKYLEVFKALWGDGIPQYLSNILQRTEVLDKTDVLYFWKMSLRHEELHNGDDEELEAKAEEELMKSIKEDGVFDEVMRKIFPGGLPKLLKTDLKDASISELQAIWKSEEGVTKESWEKKHMAYIKLMVIYSVSHILGTIDFERKRFLKEQIGKYVPADLKTKVSTCLKLLTKYLEDSTEPDPTKIKDTVRTRIDVVFPEGVLETGNPTEIKHYVVRKVAETLAMFGTSFDASRLRNSYIKGGINRNSGDIHRALQVTLITSCDYDEDGNINPCPEAYPLELQFPAELTPQERKDDDKKYNEKKLAAVRRALGTKIEFFDYVSHLADLFIKEPELIEETSGGTYELSDVERLGIKFIKILSTDDPETFKLLKDKIDESSKVYGQKFKKALKALEKYWHKKHKTFILERFAILTDVLEEHDGVAVNRMKDYINRSIGKVAVYYNSKIEKSTIIKQDEHDCYVHVARHIELILLSIQDLTKEQKVLGQRISTICNAMLEYIQKHEEAGQIEQLVEQGDNGLERLLA
ncbi:hypothetical protein ACFL3T_00190 [Patescibacteria group bacterium]